jgi:PTH1 family peptidyl-tRNA hydrolase
LWRWKWIPNWRGRNRPAAEPARLIPVKLIVGLGNPGRRYRQTPHNLGFVVAERLALESQIPWEGPEDKALVGRGLIAEIPLLLVKPQTFMNLSGQAIAALFDRYKLGTSDLVVICDDLSLPFGKLRIRREGSSGGHKGLQSIIDILGTQQFARIRLGIAPEEPREDAAGYVLSPLPPEYGERAERMVQAGVEALKMILSRGMEAAMSSFNR